MIRKINKDDKKTAPPFPADPQFGAGHHQAADNLTQLARFAERAEAVKPGKTVPH